MSKVDPNLEFDFDGDGVPDVLVADTNGHRVYVDLRLIIYGGSALFGLVSAWLLV